MNDENRTTKASDMGTTKQPWTQPRIESVEGRQASASNIFSYGGPDNNFYS